MATTQRSALKQLQCPNCGSPVDQHHPGTQTIVCETCGSHLGIGMGEPAMLGEGTTLGRPPKPIKPGDVFALMGVSYIVLGRVDYEGWDSANSSDRWRWTEWLLGAEDGRMLWLSYDDEAGFVLFRKIRIRAPFNPQTSAHLPIDNQRSAIVKERYPARILGAKGELTWQAKAGDQLNMVEGAGMGKRYSLQVAESELELYEGVPVEETAIAAALGDDGWLERTKNRKARKAIMRFAGIAAFIFALIGLCLGAAFYGYSGDKITSETVRLNVENPRASIPIDLDNANRPTMVKLKLNGSLPANTWAEIDVSVRDPDEVETYVFTSEFWRETGTDSDGPWDESDYSGSGRFIPDAQGQHEVLVDLSAINEDIQNNTISVEVAVYKNSFLYTWFLGYGGLAGIIGLGLMAFGFPETAGNFVNSILED
ncbi:MAG: DUF4178 domain-containing protein [Chloroflexi bacterium]|nr:DUF4178 domain-containing protein [Chloroflexota bacterium]